MTCLNGGSYQKYSQQQERKENVCMIYVPTVTEQAEARMEQSAYTESPALALGAGLGHKRTDFTSEDWT